MQDDMLELKKSNAELSAELKKEKDMWRKYKRSLKQHASDEPATFERMDAAIVRMEEGDSDVVSEVFIERMEEDKQSYTGVTCMPSKRYRAYVLKTYLGMHDTEKGAADAVDAYYRSVCKIPSRGFNMHR